MIRGFAIAAALGAISGAGVAIVTGVCLSLILGLRIEFSIGPAALAGCMSSVTWAGLARPLPHTPQRFLTAGCAYGILLSATTAFSPMGLDLVASTAESFAVVALMAALTVACSRFAMKDADMWQLNRFRAEVILSRALKLLGLAFFSAIVILPFYAMLMTSFKKQSQLLADPLDYSIDISQGLAHLFNSYHELFTTFDFGRFVLVSLFVATSTVFLTLLASIPGAYAISRLNFPGRTALARSVLLIYMVPAIVLVIPLYAVFSQLGLRDSLLGLLIIYPTTTIPVSLYMLQGYFRNIPAELEEAGLMDGCSRFQVICKITLPLSLPAIASVSLYIFMIAWNEFLFAFMFLDSPSIFTLPRAVVSLNSSEVPRQHLMAGAVIVTVPVLVLFLWFERYLVSGLTAGSVKG